MHLRRLRAGEWIGALGGAALLVALFLSWYDSASGWGALTVADILLAAIAVFAVALLPIALAGKVALVIVLIRMISPPGSAEGLEAGIWLALVASVAIVVGGWVAMRDERLSPSGEHTDLTGRPAPPPPEVEVLPAP